MKGQEATAKGGRVGWGCGWMEELREDGGGRTCREEPGTAESLCLPHYSCSSDRTPADGQPHRTSWHQALPTRRTWRGLCVFAPVGVVWLVCQVETLLHSSVLVVDVCWRLLSVCLLWIVLGACVYALKYCLRPGQDRVKLPHRMQPEVAAENRSSQCSWMSQSRSPGLCFPKAHALANSLLLCVLQEPLLDPGVPHIQALLSRLESVSHTLEKTDTGPEVTLEEVDHDSTLTDKVKLICTYLQQRMKLLHTLVQVQGDFEASVKDMLEGLDGLWHQLEQLHTGVTLTKEGPQGQGDLVLAHTDTENLFAVLGRYRNRLQCCQTCLKDSTQLLQELTWSHTSISSRVSSGTESVWPELLLQSNIEQFDKVQESFLSLEQQTSTFQAHLEGLAQGSGSNSRSDSPQTSLPLNDRRISDVSLEHCNSTSASMSASSVDEDTEADTPLSLCERSALHLSSTMGRLRKSGRKK